MMQPTQRRANHRPRELRRRVMMPARVRVAAGWSDACILNLSSRGLMIKATPAALRSGQIELWHQEHMIIATIVWREGTRAGLRAEGPLPVEEIMALGQGPSLQLTAQCSPQADRRRKPRSHDDSRFRARAFEFASVTLIAVSLAMAVFGMVEQSFAKPLFAVRAALGG